MKTITKCLNATILMFVLSACSTPYQENSKLNFFTPGGFTDERIAETTWRIKFVGNGSTSDEKVGRYLLFRCAELTREHGFRYFVVVPAEVTGGLSMDTGPRPRGIDPSMMVKAHVAGGIILLPGGWAGVIRSKSVTIHMLQDPQKVPFRMMGWDVNDVYAALEPYVRSGGDQPGHVPPAYAFDPSVGLISYKGIFEDNENPSSPGQASAPSPGGYNGSVSMDSLNGLLPGNTHAP